MCIFLLILLQNFKKSNIFQKAMKENNINLDEVDLEILGTENEKTKSSTDES